MTVIAILAACSGSPAVDTQAVVVPVVPPEAVSVQLNWFPEPEFGGMYEAREAGLYDKAGLAVDIVAGGAGTPVVPQVATGRAAFGISAADEVVLAQSQGADIVAVFATYQTHPACVMVHAKRGLTDLSQLTSGTLAVEDGIPFATWLFKKYGFNGVTRVPYGGGVAAFLLDVDYAQQGYVTSEPILAKNLGGDPQCFLVADTGYNPYANVLVTSGAMIKDHPETVRKFVEATAAGWTSYLADPKRANAKIHAENPTLDEGVLAEMATVQVPLVSGGDAATHGLGWMDEARWTTLEGQLTEIGALTGTAPDVKKLFTNEFLPKK
jgi:NitT/TauT family transport system substrate-binding protein